MRSFVEPVGFWPSSLAHSRTPGFGDIEGMPTSGGCRSRRGRRRGACGSSDYPSAAQAEGFRAADTSRGRAAVNAAIVVLVAGAVWWWHFATRVARPRRPRSEHCTARHITAARSKSGSIRTCRSSAREAGGFFTPGLVLEPARPRCRDDDAWSNVADSRVISWRNPALGFSHQLGSKESCHEVRPGEGGHPVARALRLLEPPDRTRCSDS